MFEKIEELERHYQEMEGLLADPATMADQGEFRKLSKEHAGLSEIVDTYRRYRKLGADLEDNRQLLKENDPEIRALAEEEVPALEGVRERVAEQIKTLLLPEHPNDDRILMLELRACAGGDEPALF